MASKDDKAAGKKPDAMVRIRAARDGFRRAGRAWSREPVEVSLAELSAVQIALLEAEPLITIEPVEAPAKP